MMFEANFSQIKPKTCPASGGVDMTGVMTAISTITANTTAPLLNDLSELLTRHVQEQSERTAVGTSAAIRRKEMSAHSRKGAL
jgi:hypothetical protein